MVWALQREPCLIEGHSFVLWKVHVIYLFKANVSQELLLEFILLAFREFEGPSLSGPVIHSASYAAADANLASYLRLLIWILATVPAFFFYFVTLPDPLK